MLIFLDVVFFSLLLFIFNVRHSAQVSITFSPNEPLCIGEQLEMICYIEPPPSESFGLSTAQVSFNGSTPANLGQINNDDVIGGIDLTRYSANTDGLDTTPARPGIRLIISSYLPLDSDTTFGCHGIFPNSSTSDAIVSGMPMGQAAVPLPPSSLLSTLSGINSNTCESTVDLSWTPGASDREIEYFLFEDGADLNNFNSSITQYSFLTSLQLNTNYSYSILAMSCAGNSTTQTADPIAVISYSLADNNPDIFLTYNQSNGMLTLEWSLLPSPVDQDILIEYSLELYYNHTLSGTTDQFSNSSTFLQLSSITVYSINITPHTSSDNTGVLTIIIACLNITQQCGQQLTSIQRCSVYNSDNPPMTTTPPTATATATSVNVTGTTAMTIIIGVVGAIGGILLILFIVLFFIMLYICCIRKKRVQSSPKRSTQDDHVVLAVTPSSEPHPDTQPTYAQVNKAKSLKTAELYSSVNKPKPAPQSELMYLELDHMRTASDRINPSSIPTTNYSDLAQLPRSEQTTYATVTDGPLH
ncbi:hypothetical protein LOD99_6926 [Oopsacas minuta]|uniref:Fibronectin type-III domain-containing protein n=1 Tax=Oopsacas minuta TaxID=111878 RepID=A0AAV7JJ85_9METZ|nr:hypothetical protein LOD99_6926 [Oopsacas minuta]